MAPQKRVIVIGAGPSGLMAAGQASKAGAETLLLEKMARPAIKFSMTGNSRGNLTHIGTPSDFIPAFRKNGRFLRQAFSRFFNQELVAFFSEIGVETVVEQDGKIYTKSGIAARAAEALMVWARQCGVAIKIAEPAMSLVLEGNAVKGVLLKDGSCLEADAVAVCTGGATYPGTGSSGDGFVLAESAGHQVTAIRPALVPLETIFHAVQGLQGLSLDDVNVRVFASGKLVAEARGDMLFTHYGLSGPAVLSVSGDVADELLAGHGPVIVSLDLVPDLPEKAVDDDLINRFDTHGTMMVRTHLSDRLPGKLSAAVMDRAEIPLDTHGHQIKKEKRKALVSILKGWQFEITSTRSMTEAMVTRGGVSLDEVDPRTMESRKVKGLYFAGEVLDLDGDTGGYNLQAAFSTGYVAGNAMQG